MVSHLSFEDHCRVRPVWADVSLDAITANLAEVKRRVGRNVQIIAPVKADAYGHGIVAVGRHLEAFGVDAMATANFDDAVLLRESGVTLPILMFASNLASGIGTLREYGLTPTVYDEESADVITRNTNGIIDVHVKVDAGLGRVGVKLRQAREFVLGLARNPHINVEGVYTHIAFSDEAGQAWSRRRLAAFTDFIKTLQTQDGLDIKYAQASASSTIVCGFEDSLNTISPGHLLFGLCPVKPHLANMAGFTPALQRLAARLIHVTEHCVGDDIAVTGSYGLSDRTRTGVILCGLDNGFHMPSTGDGYMLCHGKRCAILSVTAEYTVIDLSGVDDAHPGDAVTIIGSDGTEAIGIEHVTSYLGASTPAGFLVDLRRIPIRHHQEGVSGDRAHTKT